MKKILVLILFICTFLYIDVSYASSGKLRESSIKICNGIKYGQHGGDNHWHVADEKQYPIGDAIYDDPCRGSNISITTTTTTTTTRPVTTTIQVTTKPITTTKSIVVPVNNIDEIVTTTTKKTTTTEKITTTKKTTTTKNITSTNKTTASEVNTTTNKEEKSKNDNTEASTGDTIIGLGTLGGGGYLIYKKIKKKKK